MRHLTRHIVFALAGLAMATPALAADHIDSPAATAEPAADISDLYAWMTPDASKVNLVLNVSPFAGADSSFSDAAVYAFHVNSSAGYGMDQTETLILCKFADAAIIECWAGDEYVTGDPSSLEGITSEGGGLKVFAGLRNDPFFMEFTGFTNAVATATGAAPGLVFDEAGCPAVDEATSAALVGLLTSGTDGAPASDTFAGSNVLSLVVQVDKSVLTGGGPLLGVWASTHAAQ